MYLREVLEGMSTRSKIKLLWVICTVTFLSAVLDNLTIFS